MGKCAPRTPHERGTGEPPAGQAGSSSRVAKREAACVFLLVGAGDAEAEAELRVLRSRSAAEFAGRKDLLVRVHVLRDLRRRPAGRDLPELRRRAGAPADPPAGRPGALSGLDRTLR